MSVDPDEGGFQLGIHWPHCIDRSCSGCMPKLSLPIVHTHEAGCGCLDLSTFRRDVGRERQSG